METDIPLCTARFVGLNSGQLFTLKVSCQQQPCSKAIVLIPPFAEEMNKSRKMMKASLDAFSDTADGFLFDLYGTGDSEGLFDETSWDIWKRNIADFLDYLLVNFHYQEIELVTFRTGALLLNDCLDSAPNNQRKWPISAIHYCNPVIKAQQFINQFLRLKLAAEMMRSDGDKRSTKDLMVELEQQGKLEVAGYMLSDTLLNEMLSSVAKLPEYYANTPLFFYDVSARGVLTPAITNNANTIRSDKLGQIFPISGPQFWSTQEISMCHELIAAVSQNLTSGELQ